MKKRKRKMERQLRLSLSDLANSNQQTIAIASSSTLTFTTLILFALLALLCRIDCDPIQSDVLIRERAQSDAQHNNHLLDHLAGVAINNQSASLTNNTTDHYAINTPKIISRSRVFPESTSNQLLEDHDDLLALETSSGPKLLAIGNSTNTQPPYASSLFEDSPTNRHHQPQVNRSSASINNSTIPWRFSNESQLVKLYRASPWPIAVPSQGNLSLIEPLFTGNHLLPPKLIGAPLTWPLSNLQPALQISAWPTQLGSRPINESFPFVLPKFSTSSTLNNETTVKSNETSEQTITSKTNEEQSRKSKAFGGEREGKFPSVVTTIEASGEDEFERGSLSVGNYQRTNMVGANNLSWSELLRKAAESNVMESLMVTNRSMVSLLCDTNLMLLKFKFKQPFHGSVMTNLDPFRSCKLIGTGAHYYEMRISLSDCGTRQETPKLFVNNIQIQFNDGKRTGLSELDLIEEQEVKTIICSYPIRPRAPPPPDLGLRSGNLPERIVEAAPSPSEPAKLVYYEPLVLISGLLLLSLTLLGLTTSAYLFTKRAGRHQARGLSSPASAGGAPQLYRVAPAQLANRFMAPPLIWGSPSAAKGSRKSSRAGRPGRGAPMRQGSDNRSRKEGPAEITIVKSLPPESLPAELEGLKSDRSRDSLAPDRDSRDSVTTIEIPYSPIANLHQQTTHLPGSPEKVTGEKVNPPATKSSRSLVVPRFGSLRKTLTSPEEFKRLQEIARLFGEILIEKRIDEGDRRGTKIVYKSRLSPSKYREKILDNLDETERRKVRKALCNDELLRSFVVESTDRETFRRKLRFNPHYANKFKPITWELLEEILLDSEISSSSQTSSNSTSSKLSANETEQTEESDEHESDEEEEQLENLDQKLTTTNDPKSSTIREHLPGQRATNRVSMIEAFDQTGKLPVREDYDVKLNELSKPKSPERAERHETESVLVELNARQEDTNIQSDADSLEMRAAIETRMISNTNRTADGGEQFEQMLELSEDTSSKAVVRVSQFNSTHTRTREGGMSGTLINIDHVINYTTNFG